MENERRGRLENKDGKVGTVDEFLGITFDKGDILQVTKTARSSGAVGPNAKVPKVVLSMAYDTTDWILDYGSGPKAIHTKTLRDAGYSNAWAYDFAIDPIVNRMFIEDLSLTVGKWDIIFASNVLNIQVSEKMMDVTLNEIWQLMGTYTIFITNYSNSPRKLNLNTEAVYSKLRAGFGRVHRTHGDVFVCSRPILSINLSKNKKVKEGKLLTRMSKLTSKEGE